MHAIIIFGFMLPVAAIRIWKPVTGVDWKMALLTCSANKSRLPRVRVKNSNLELVDNIASNISNTFWLDAVYETIQIDPFNVSDNDLGFPRVCCSVFPAFTDTCMDSCISCNATHRYKCEISQQSVFPGAGPWIRARRLCPPPSTWTREDKDGTYWNHDIRRFSLNLTSSGQENDTCTYFCAGSVLIRECSDSSGVDTVCVTDEVENLYPSNTSTVSSDMGNSSLEYTEETLSTQSISNTERSTDGFTTIHTQTTEGIDDQRSTSQLISTSFAFTKFTTKSNKDTYTTLSTMSGGTFNPYVTSMSTQVTTSGISTSNTSNTMSITKDDPYVFITLIVVIATVLIAFFVVLVMYCRLRKASLNSQRSETNMTHNLSFPDFSRRNPIYGVDHDLVVNGDLHRHVSYSDREYETASNVSGSPTGASNVERQLPPESEERSQLGGSMNADIYARPIKVQSARPPSKDETEEKRENENSSGGSDIYALPRKDGKFRKDSNDTERTLNTIDHKTMDPVEDNVSKARLSGKINETSEGEYDMTDLSSRTLENGTPENIYDTTNFHPSRPLLHTTL